ncbi:DUF4811 domain-containing protein [Eupransor demetentiae]|uniref:DUF4811 domain-containing protein n=1 Tax=Eupransor demetentiae TaxID=3109584 RepID=A0ABM9N5B7_9LACO|nr:hypothetical protein R54876_GBNLAHCA_00910 [Lactobacillaceae bacterium LMG 33000]
MIILLLLIFVIFAFYTILYLEKPLWRILGGVIGFAGIIASVALITANMHDHFGMKTETVTSKTQIYSAASTASSDDYGVLLYQPLGTNGKENVYIYRSQKNSLQPKPTEPDLKTTTKRQSISGEKAYLYTKTTRYVYKNGFWSFLFGWADNNKEIKTRTQTYQIPDNWIALSTAQAKQLQKKLKADPSSASDSQGSAEDQVSNLKQALGIK